MSQRTFNPNQRLNMNSPTAAPPPPPYEEAGSQASSDSDESERRNESATNPSPSPPIKVTVNAAHNIQGCNNLIPTSPTPVVDATKLGAMLLQAFAKGRSTANDAQQQQTRPLGEIQLIVNCGITVIGHRNVVGAFNLKPRTTGGANTTTGASIPATAFMTEGPILNENNVSTGAKRKAEEVCYQSALVQ